MEIEPRNFSREFKFEAVKLVRERVVSVSAARDLELHKNVLRKWVCEQAPDLGSACPEHGVMKPGNRRLSGFAATLPR